MDLEVLPPVTLDDIPVEYYEPVRRAARAEGVKDQRATIVRWAIVQFGKHLAAASGLAKSNQMENNDDKR